MYFVTGTDTNVGKTLVCQGLVHLLDAFYWKPIQAGDLQTGGDSGSMPAGKIFPNRYALPDAIAPHLSAQYHHINMALTDFTLPPIKSPLIVEGAGGLYVPLNHQHYMIDLIKHLNLPTILVARTSLGTINHTLLSVKALQSYNIPIKGIVFSGESYPDTIRTIIEHTGIHLLATIPMLNESQKTGTYVAHFFNKNDFY